MLKENEVTCPYCGEMFITQIDLSAGDQHYVEDCQICCCPIVFDIKLDASGELQQLSTRSENE